MKGKISQCFVFLIASLTSSPTTIHGINTLTHVHIWKESTFFILDLDQYKATEVFFVDDLINSQIPQEAIILFADKKKRRKKK